MRSSNPAPRMTMTWHGFGLPRVGHFMRSEKGKVAYEICAMRIIKQRNPQRGVTKFVATCTRHPVNDVPEGATVHFFNWHKRG